MELDWRTIVEEFSHLETEEEIFRLLLSSLERYGAEYIQFGELGPILTSDQHAVGNFPEEWFDHYLDNDYWQIDPIFTGALGNGMPSNWEDLGKASPQGLGQKVINEATEFGLVEGWAVPINQINGYKAVLSICGEKVEKNPELYPLLHMLVVYAHGKVLNLRSQKGPDNALAVLPHPPVLTSREAECLRWVAAGKSNWEIGEILKISDRTVHKHIESAKAKYGVTTRLQAVVSAIRSGTIPLI